MRGSKGTKLPRNHTARHQQSPKLAPDPPSPQSTPPVAGCPGQMALGVHSPTESLHSSKHQTRDVHRFICTKLQGQASLPSTAASLAANAEPLSAPARPGSGSHLAGHAVRHSDLPAEIMVLPALQSRHCTAHRAQDGWPQDQG